MIIYTSDHGEFMGFHHMLLKSNHMYDPLVKVPLIIKYPGERNKRAYSDELVNNIDLAPTLLKIAQSQPDQHMAGIDLKMGTAGRDYIICEGVSARQYMIRSHTHKLLYSRDRTNHLFFDIVHGSRINQTPNLDRIAEGGMRLDNCFCTNSICAPSRAVILSGKYSHLNGVKTLADNFDGRQVTFPKLLQGAGYQTAMIGKWHLGHGGDSDPTGFDYWSVLPGQGKYHDPVFIEMGVKTTIPGYVTTITTDLSMEWLKKRDKDKPFLLMCHYKAPHGPWEPDTKHEHLYEDVEIPEPVTFYDDYSNRAEAAMEAKMRIDRDLPNRIPKYTAPEGLSPIEGKKWKYQQFIKDYLRCVASIDENVGRLLDYLDEEGLAENTIVVYTSDQGFYLGDHGWYDKRFMYEESLRMPMLIRYPKEIEPSSISEAFALNVDFAPTFLDYADVKIPEEMQGSSLRPILKGELPDGWQTSVYYRYWMHLDKIHGVYSHYGVRTEKYKLIYYYGEALGASGTTDISTPKEWELFDLDKDPHELNNVYNQPEYSGIVTELKAELERLKTKVKDEL